MAQRVVVELTSDLSGTAADETVSFSVDGVAYEIDLTTEEAGKMRSEIEPFVSRARKVGRQGTSVKRTRGTGGGDLDAAAVRAWAATNGVEVSGRGRISRDVLEKYRAAQN